LRANKATSAWGVEARVPFLDKSFINVAMDIDPEWKMVCCYVLQQFRDLISWYYIYLVLTSMIAFL